MNSSVYSGSADSTDVTQTEGYITVWVDNNDYGALTGQVTVLGNTVFLISTQLSSLSNLMMGRSARSVALVKTPGTPILPIPGTVQIN